MKNSKKIPFIAFSLLFFLNLNIYANESLVVRNYSNYTIGVHLFPVSMIMRDNNPQPTYSTMAMNKQNGGTYQYCYLNGASYNYNTQQVETIFPLNPSYFAFFNFDRYAPVFETQGCFGYGIYKLEISYTSGKGGEPVNQVDSCLLDFDYADIGNGEDLNIYVNSPGSLQFQFSNHNVFPINSSYFYIKSWEPVPYQPIRSKVPVPSIYQSSINRNWLPIDYRRDCNDGYPYCATINQSINEYYYRAGVLSTNLTLLSGNTEFMMLTSINNPPCIDFPQTLLINPGCTLTLAYGSVNPTILYLYSDYFWNPIPPYNNYYSQIINEGTIWLNDNGNAIEVNAHDKLYLYPNSLLHIGSNSWVTIEPGAYFGMYCATISGGQIQNYGYRIKFSNILPCNDPVSLIKDSTSFILEDNSTFYIPDSSTLVIDGNITNFNLKPNSTVYFGQSSKLVLQNGAHINAQNANFITEYPNIVWDGIYLSGNSNDTIKNCIIENAVNGINITNKSSSGLNQPSTEISNCTFIDSSNVPLNDGIYCSNSSNVLIRNNTFNSTPVVEGFASAIDMVYCSSGSLDILDNSINNVTNGISVIHSSPYIERNTINGQPSDGTGIILDNSNGMVKYNTINHFSKAIVTYYSSAYLFRNNLNNSATNIIDLYQSSAPVLKPIYSGSTLRWLGGNNFFNGSSGTPSGYGIGLNDASLPVLDSGFNNMVLGGANYMAGDLFSNILPATYNYWGDRPPVDNKFAVTNGSVIDTPDYDGSSLPHINGQELTDIGFGLFDTVYTGGGSNSPGPDNLYTQAYLNEVSGNYASAINLYKEVVSTYKTSSLVPAAISRIINCMEKKISTSSDYSQLQNYMLQVRNDNSIPYAVREVAEDLIIKSMVRQNLYPYSINNYDSMYVHNEGNHKGTHALINKLSLLSFYHDTTGNHFSVSSNSNQYKLSLLSLLTGKQISPIRMNNNTIIPKQYMLYQNYPNPFNPTTKIKYDIPKTAQVIIKVYNLLGEEIMTLVNELKQAGSYEIGFNGANLASGLYFYRIQSGDYNEVRKMVLLK